MRFPCVQGLRSTRAWLKETLAPTTQPQKSPRLKKLNQLESCLIQEPNVKTLWQDSRMMAYHIRSTVVPVTPRVQILVRQSRSPELRESGRRLAPHRKIFSLNVTLKAHTVFQPLISVPKYSTCLIAGMELECQFSKLAPVGHKQLFRVISPGMPVPQMSEDILQQTASEASAVAKNRTSNV